MAIYYLCNFIYSGHRIKNILIPAGTLPAHENNDSGYADRHMDAQVRGRKVLPNGGTKQLVLQIIADAGEASIADLCEATGVSFSCMARHVEQLMQEGKLCVARYTWQSSLGSPRKLFGIAGLVKDTAGRPLPPIKQQVLEKIQSGMCFKRDIALALGMSEASVSHALASLHAEKKICWISRLIGWAPSGHKSAPELPANWQRVLDMVAAGLRTRAEIGRACGLDAKSCSHILTMLRAMGRLQYRNKKWHLTSVNLSLMMGILPGDFVPDTRRSRLVIQLLD